MVGADWIQSNSRQDDLCSRPGSIVQVYFLSLFCYFCMVFFHCWLPKDSKKSLLLKYCHSHISAFGLIQQYEKNGRPEFFFVVNFQVSKPHLDYCIRPSYWESYCLMYDFINQVPGSSLYSIGLYYMMKTPLEDNPLLHSFVHGDDAYRNSRFKLIPYIFKVNFIIIFVVLHQKGLLALLFILLLLFHICGLLFLFLLIWFFAISIMQFWLIR